MKKTAYFVLLLLLAVLLVSCLRDAEPASPVQSEVMTEAESEKAATSAAEATVATESETVTVTGSEPPTEPAWTEPVPDTEPVRTEPYVPSAAVSTNITSPAAAAALEKLEADFSYMGDAAIYFATVDGKYSFGIRERDVYTSASTIKAPYCQYIIASGADLDDTVYYGENTRMSLEGVMAPEYVGNTYTVGQLIEYAIRYSDNQAYRLLYEKFGVDGFNEYLSSIGAAGLSLSEWSEFGHASAAELSAAMLDIYRRSADDPTLLTYIENCVFSVQIAGGTPYVCAHKYGYDGGTEGFHDTAIVFHPAGAYLLTVMTHVDFDAYEDCSFFTAVTSHCDELMWALGG